MLTFKPYIVVAVLSLLIGSIVAYWYVGRATPLLFWEHRFVDLQGKPQQLSAFSGKPLVINFWASWCTPCLQEIPRLIESQQHYADKISVIGIAIDSSEAARMWRERLGVNYPIWLADAKLLPVLTVSGASGLPVTFFVDKHNQQRAVHLGILDQQQLAAYLKPLI